MTTATALTPTVGRTLKRSLFWIGAALFLIVIALAGFNTAGSTAGGVPLASDNPAPAGAMALAEVLRGQGVTVTATDTLDATRAAIDDPAATTVLVYDVDDLLTAAQWERAAGLAASVVVVDPGFRALNAIAPELAQAGRVDGTRDADCAVPAVERAGSVSGAGSGYRVVDDATGITACLGTGDDVFSLVQLERGDTVLTVLGTTDALSNDAIVQAGNAALALGVLGGHPSLVWYLPTVDDLASGSATIGDLSPAWVVPVVGLLGLTFIAAAVWRGRRFGPLVVENLPVTVRANETMLGRARLYERSSSRLRAIDALRVGAVQRLAVLCGLPSTASLDDVIASVTAATGAAPAEVRRVLVDAEPTTDRELLALSDALLDLERDVAIAVRP